MNKFLLFLILITIFGIEQNNAQVTVAYPSAAQNITRSLGTSMLDAKLTFAGACSNASVTVSLPASVVYVAGSVNKTAGNGAVITIAESNITNLSKPVFSLSNINAAGDITFTIRRKAGCGALVSAKDTVIVKGDCGSITENAAGLNTYKIYSPNFTITTPTTITGAFLGNNYTRTIKILNGDANGCADTVRFYMVYPNGGIKLQDAPVNTLSANGSDFTPWRVNGDTLFYKFYGATLFNGNTSPYMCNSNELVIIEKLKVLKCSITTTYGVYWGDGNFPGCNIKTVSSDINMANGSPVAAGSFTVTQERSACRPGIYNFKYSNNGSGGKAGAMYNMAPAIGFITNPGNLGGVFIDSVKIALNTPNLILSNGPQLYTVNASQFTADPDGVGVGLDDLDGDGQYDDLLPGQSATFIVFDHYKCTSACPYPGHAQNDNTTLTYNTMCGGTPFTTGTLHGGAGGSQKTGATTLSITGPIQVQGGVPFNLMTCTGGLVPPAYKPHDTTYVMFILPPGVALSGATGNASINGNAIPASRIYTRHGAGGVDTLFLTTKGVSNGFCWSVDLIYTCGATKTLNIDVINRYIGDNSCSCGVQNLQCGSISISAICPAGACPSGMVNYEPVVTRTTLGWTNSSLTTKVASVSGRSSYTVMPHDSLSIKAGGVETGTFNNVWYVLQLGKATGKSVFNILPGAVFNVKNKISGIVTTCTLPLPNDSSTATLQKYFWNLSSCLPAGSITTGDSAWIDVKVVTTNANNSLLYGSGLQAAPNTRSYFFNYDGNAVQTYCVDWPLNLFTNGVKITQNATQSSIALSCNNSTFSSFLTLTDGNNFDISPNEFRPDFQVDSVIVTLPSGYIYNPAVTPVWRNSIWNSTFSGTSPSTNVNPVFLSGNRVAFYRTSSSLLPSEVFVNGNSSTNLITFGILPTCSAPIANTNATVKYYLKNLAYVPATRRDTAITNTLPSIGYPLLNRPSLSIQNNTGTVQGVLPQHYWDVQINNTSTQTAPYVWFALEKGLGGVTVDSVVLLPSNVTLTKQTYGSGNVWVKETIAGIPSGGQQTARVYFKYSQCSGDSILARAGWNCGGYPTDPSAYSCTTAQIYLKVAPQPSQMQVTILREPGNGGQVTVFATDSVLFGVNSSQAGFVVNPYIEILIPKGVSPVLPIQVEYPLGSGMYEDVVTTPINGGYRIDLTAHSGIGLNGIPGTLTNPGAGGRLAKVRVNYTTSCRTKTGTTMEISGYGKMPCGSPTIGNSNSIQSTGINIDYGANGYIEPGDASVLDTVVCSKNSTTLSLTGSAGDIQWQSSPDGVNGWANVIGGTGAATSTYVTPEITLKTFYRAIATKGTCPPEPSDTIVVDVNPLPIFDLGADTTICSDASATFKSNVAFPDYKWSSGETVQSITKNAAGKYYLTVTDANKCSSTDTVKLSINQLPVFDLGADTAICSGASVTFKSSAAFPDYKWGSGETVQSITKNVAGKYYLTVTDANNCSSTDTVKLAINQLPVFDLGADTAICSGASVTFKSDMAFPDYKWSSGETIQSITKNAAGKYYLTVTDANKCSSTDTVKLSINQLPVFNIGADTSICDGASVTFKSNVAFPDYKWSSGETIQSITKNAAGKFYLTVTDANKCSSTDTIKLSINQLPVFSLGADTSICEGVSVTFKSNMAFPDYKWSSGETIQSITKNVAGKYYLTVTDGNKCSSTDTVKLSINQLPVFDLGADTAICGGASVTFKSSAPFPDYKWSSGETVQSITKNSAGNYYLTVTDGNKCSSTDTVKLSINQLPVFDLGADTAICFGSSVTFKSSKAFPDYKWSSGETVQSITKNVAGKYYLTVTDANKCSSTDTVKLSINLLPVFNIGADTAICFGSSVTFKSSKAFPDYKWSSGETVQSITKNVAGKYYLIVTDGNKCSSTDTVKLSVNLLPVFNIGADTAICFGSSVTFKSSKAFPDYKWSSGETVQSINKNSAGKYYLTVTDANECSSTDTVKLSVNQLPLFSLGADTSICDDGSKAKLDPVTNFVSYLWNTGEKTKTISTSIKGEYTLTVTDVNGCKSSDKVNVSLFVYDFVSRNDTSICEGIEFRIIAKSGFFNYEWQDGSKGPQYIVLKPGSYTVKAKSAEGCPVSDVIVIGACKIPKIPNVITPNGDGVNDFWVLQGFDPVPSVEIYNRWGTQVFSNRSYLNTWDAASVNDGTYFYIIKEKSGVKHTGYIEVIK